MKRLLALLVVVAGVSGIAVALASRGTATPRWDWGGGVPGGSHALTRVERAVAGRERVEADSIRQAAAAGELKLLAGRHGDDVCLASSTGELVTGYECSADLARPLFLHTLTSGGPSGVADYALVGAARSDVRRVRVTLSDGSERTLPFGRWHTFTFAAQAPAPMPVTIAAYGADGVLTTEAIGASPPN